MAPSWVPCSLGENIDMTRATGATGVLATPGVLSTERSAGGLGTYVSFVKPHIDLTFALVAATGSVLAGARSGHLPVGPVIGVVVAVALLSAGAECWTNLLDRDMDAVMRRTGRRALPSGLISTKNATTFGAALTAGGLAVAATLGTVPLFFLIFALFNNVIVYSALTKRTTPWSIVLGSGVGPLTLWAGYSAVAEPISRAALLLGAMVAAWVPVHIWAIATRYRDDYARASIPMAPVVWGRRSLAAASAVSGLAMGALATWGIASIGGRAAAWAAAPVAVVSAAVVVWSSLLPWREQWASRLIRLVTAYLVVVLVVAIGLAA